MGMINALSYLGLGIVMLLVGFVLFTFTTKMSERAEILEKGNRAAAYMLVGKLIGLSIVIMAAAKYSVSVQDYIIWGLLGIVAQFITYLVIEFLLFPKVSIAQKVQEGNVAVGITLLGASIAIGLLIAGCLSYDLAADILLNNK